MLSRTPALFVAAFFLSVQALPNVAYADNPMGYQLLSAQQAATLPQQGGTLGMNVGRGQEITSGGMSFELLRVNAVRPSSPGAQAGLKTGDQIIAVDGRVFPSVAAFAAYVGSKPPGAQVSIDTLPAGGGPQQAQRVAVTLGRGGHAEGGAPAAGMSTSTKIAIGVAAAALFGCYETGCLSKLKSHLNSRTQAPAPQTAPRQ